MSRGKGMQTDETYLTENTLPIIFMNNIREPILASGVNTSLIKKQIKPRGSIELPSETIQARDVIQRYYEQHDMRPFFNSRPGYKPNIETNWKAKNESVRYSHIKPRVNTNIQRKANNRSISYSDKSRTIQVKKSNQYRKIVSKTNTPKLSLYLQPFITSKDELILPKIIDKNPKQIATNTIDYINTEPVLLQHKTQSSIKQFKNGSVQTIRPQKLKIISYESINTSIKPTIQTIQTVQTISNPVVAEQKVQEHQQDSIQKDEVQELSAIRVRKNSLQSQTFSVMTKPNFDLGRFGERVITTTNNQANNTNRKSVQSTLSNWRKNINPQITEEKMEDMVKQFKPKSDLLKDADITKFKIKKYKNGVYFGQLKKDQTSEQPNQLKSGLGCIFYYNGRLYEGEFQNDLKNGKGYQLYPDSSYYHGDFSEGHKSGKGVFVWNNGEMYWGEWAQGKKHGSGTWKGTEGSKQSYFGQWYNGKPHGFGVLTNAIGDVYQGEFKLSVKDGKGTQRFVNGDVYVGQYVKGRRNGPKQSMYYKNGQIYVGQFCNNVRHGRGLLKHSDQKPIYEGQYQNDKKCGEGMLWLDNIGVYEGNFQNDLMHGIGKVIGYNHTVRNGYWLNGKQLFDNNNIKQQKNSISLQPISQRYKPRNYNTLKAHNKSVSYEKPKMISPDKKVMRSVKSDSKFADLKRVYLTRQKPAVVESKFHRRACGCLKKH